MPCVRCTGLAEEVTHGDSLDEVLCNFCGQHYLKSTNHSGPWRVYVQTDCPDCRWININTDNVDFYNFWCSSCNTEYMWTKPTGWICLPVLLLPPSIPTEPRQYPLLSHKEKMPSAPRSSFSNNYIVMDTVNPQEPDTYESCYWKFVESGTWDDANYWKNQMLSQVTLNLEPKLDGKSWSADKPGSLANIKTEVYKDRFLSLKILGMMAIFVLIPTLFAVFNWK